MARSVDQYELEVWEAEEREEEDKYYKELHDYLSDTAGGAFPESSEVATGRGVYVVSMEPYGRDYDYGPFYRALAELQARQVLRFLWIISTDRKPAPAIRDRLSEFLRREDCLFVATLSHITTP